MKIFLAADHRGLKLKEQIKEWLASTGHTVTDLGPDKLDPQDDYPDFGLAAAQRVANNPGDSLGILLCGSGIGMAIAANKVPEVRAALVLNPEMTAAGRRDDNINVIALAADWTTFAQAKEIIAAAFNTPFSQEPRYQRRLNKINQFVNKTSNHHG